MQEIDVKYQEWCHFYPTLTLEEFKKWEIQSVYIPMLYEDLFIQPDQSEIPVVLEIRYQNDLTTIILFHQKKMYSWELGDYKNLQWELIQEFIIYILDHVDIVKTKNTNEVQDLIRNDKLQIQQYKQEQKDREEKQKLDAQIKKYNDQELKKKQAIQNAITAQQKQLKDIISLNVTKINNINTILKINLFIIVITIVVMILVRIKKDRIQRIKNKIERSIDRKSRTKNSEGSNNRMV